MSNALFFWLQVSNFTMCLARSIINPFFPPFAKAKGVSEEVIGLIIGCNPIGAFLASLVLGKVQNKVIFFSNHFLFILIGCVVQGLGMYGFAITYYLDNAYILITVGIISRIVNGIGTSLFFTPLYAMIPILYEKDVEKKLSISELVCGLGFMFGPVLGSVTYSLGGYIMPFIFFGTIAVILAFIVNYILRKLDHGKSFRESVVAFEEHEALVKQKESVAVEKQNISYITVCLTYSGSMLFIQSIMSQYQFTYYSPFVSEFYETTYGVAEENVGYLQFIPALAYAIGSIIVGNVKSNRKLVSSIFRSIYFQAFLIGNFLIGVACVFLGPDGDVVPFEPKLYQSLIGQAAVAGLNTQAFIYLIPIFNDVLNHIYPDNEEQVANISSALFVAGMQLGEFVGPILGGVFTRIYGFPRANTFTALLTIAVNILFIPFVFINQNKRKEKLIAAETMD